ncbi:methylenetetrahydrofolate reductase [Rhodococcus wratislaviensis]|uniref:methylenetetrahydrofolate reductase n=1 Tax=Rhodococcus wratislaviensis TaxID=44752 RepID=UPI003653F094
MTTISAILEDFSVEITGRDVDALHESQTYLPRGIRVNVTFLGNETPSARRTAAAAVKAADFTPVPHIAARRLASREVVEEFVGALHADGTCDHIFVIAGDPPQPEGSYEGALSLIETAPLAEYGVQTVSITGYPEGHPKIADDVLWVALTEKVAALTSQNRTGDIITQFAFDADAVISWIEAVRSRGIDLPIRVGVPGPAGVKRLLSYARRFGVGSSAGIAKKYGFSLTNLFSTAGPDRFITDLASRVDPSVHGTVKLHFYTFGGLRATAEWVQDFAAQTHDTAKA